MDASINREIYTPGNVLTGKHLNREFCKNPGAHVAGKHKPGNAGSGKTSGINTKTTRFKYFIT